MEFITENYLWIILFVIFVLMAIVGYIAEKTGFISNAENPIAKQKRELTKEQPVIIENRGIDELLKEATSKVQVEDVKEEKKSKSKKSKSKKSKEIEEPLEELNTVEITPLTDDFMTPDITLNENFVEPTLNEAISDDIMSPLVSDSIMDDNEPIDQSLFAPLESTEMVSDVVDDVQELPSEITSLEGFEQPQDSVLVNDENTVVNPDEDIWKF